MDRSLLFKNYVTLVIFSFCIYCVNNDCRCFNKEAFSSYFIYKSGKFKEKVDIKYF